jgi:PAS domain S-box-containing protein
MAMVWIMAAVNILLAALVIFFFIRTSRRAWNERMRAEAERIRYQEHEQRLRRIFEAEPHGILVLGLDYRVRQLNPAGCLLFEAGFPEEIVGKDVREYIRPNSGLQIEEMQKAAREGRETCGKGRLVGLSGQVRWIEITFVPLPASDGTVQAILGVVRDVTEHRRAARRQALQHAVAKVLAGASTLDQAIPDLLHAIVVNLDWQLGLFWRVQDDRQTLICTHDWSVDATVVRKFLNRSRQEAYRAGSDLPGHCWARGEPLWVEDITQSPLFTRGPVEETGMLRVACAFPIWLRVNVYGVMELFGNEPQIADGDFLRALATVGRQIGLFVERVEVEAALHEHEARTSLMIDAALDAVVTMDRTGRITEWNARAEQIFGWSVYEVIGRDVADTIFPPSHRLSYREYVQRLLETREAPVSNRLVEMIGLRRDGQEFPVEIAMTPLAVEGSILFSAFIRDITGRKEAEQALQDYAQQLEQINRQLDVALREAKAATEARSLFLATMSHEIRTPMNGVIGMTDLLLETALTDEQREYAETVRTCGNHLLTIINDILDFSKIEAGKLDLEVIEFDLRLTIDESLELVAERASSKGLNLACLFHADVPRRLRGDPGRLRQVVTNLAANAIKFTENGDVTVEVTVEAQSEEEATIRVAVTDTGIGISEQARERLFRSFSQADGSTTRKYGGTGLGLAICKRLVEMMGGTIGVTSRVGEGSCFWFIVNLRKQAGNLSSAEVSAAVLTGLRILIVEEKAINRRILESMTRKWGMHPTVVQSGSEALAILGGQDEPSRFDCALLDMDMSPTDGIELARAIKTQPEGREIKLVLLTSFGRRGDAKAAKDAGLAAYLTKPIRERPLHDCLVAVITQHSVDSRGVAARVAPSLVTLHTLAETKANADLRILLAEDNIINQKVAVRLFQRLGYRIDVVANGREAVEAVSRSRYDVVFMDCQMPDLDGFEATLMIRQREASRAKRDVHSTTTTTNGEREGPSRVFIIAMTANAMQGDREQCLAAGMDDYLSKPISVDALTGILSRVNRERERSRWGHPPQAA